MGVHEVPYDHLCTLLSHTHKEGTPESIRSDQEEVKVITLSREQLEKAIVSSKTMKQASLQFECCWRTFVREAKKHGLYRSGVGNNGNHRIKVLLQEILEGKHPTYPTSHLSKRLVIESVKEYRCEECQITSHNGKPISLELDHIDGCSTNHHLENLRLLCPNCHSQTPTYRSKKLNGGLAEWSIASVLKTEGGKTSVGSNPTPSSKL